jgi:phospholipid/cholesterol/gamma-HCH transport system ATP-binding protein
MDAAEPLIEVEKLEAWYGKRRILHQVDFRVNAGEIRVIMGGSGSGKSTLLRHLLGLRKPEGGTVKLLGVNVGNAGERELQEVRRKIGVSFQGGALLTSLSVGENVCLPLREHTRLDENTIRIMSRIKLEVVNLGGFQDLMPSQLSGGMVKRAALARALALDPTLLFLDEPTSGLDPISAAAFDDLIAYLQRELRLTVVMITHDLDSIFRICNRVGVIVDRKMVTGTLDEIVGNPHPWIRSYFHGERAKRFAGEEARHGA